MDHFVIEVAGQEHVGCKCILDAICIAKSLPICRIVRSDGALMYERRRPMKTGRVFVMPARMRRVA